MKGKGKGKDSAKAVSPTQGIQRTLLLEPTKLPPHRAGMSGTRTVITLIPVGTMPHMMNSTHIPIVHMPPRQGHGARRREEHEATKVKRKRHRPDRVQHHRVECLRELHITNPSPGNRAVYGECVNLDPPCHGFPLVAPSTG